MKKSKSWIHVCVHFLLFMTIQGNSSILGRVIDDIDRELPILKQNIPRDYKIPFKYIPKETAEMCWVKLNIHYLKKSLNDLSDKFGNISSNKETINKFIWCLEEEEIQIQAKTPMLSILMDEFNCHYREERWETEKYFDFFKELYRAAPSENKSEECDPPPCPTTPTPPPTEEYSTVSPHRSHTLITKDQGRSTHLPDPPSSLQQVLEKSLFSLLFIPLLALIFLLVWKVKSRRNADHPQSNPEEEVFTTTEQMVPRLNDEPSEKNVLNICETV